MTTKKIHKISEVTEERIPDVELKTITGRDPKTHLLVLENQTALVKLFRRTLEQENRDISFAVDEKDAVVWQGLDRFDIFVWVGWNVPTQATSTHLRRNVSKETAVKSVRDSTTSEDIINKKPYIIAVTHAKDFFTPEECQRLGIREQIVGPPDYRNAGVFKDRLTKSVIRAERELRKETV